MGLWRLHLVGHELSAFYERLLDVVVMAFVGAALDGAVSSLFA